MRIREPAESREEASGGRRGVMTKFGSGRLIRRASITLAVQPVPHASTETSTRGVNGLLLYPPHTIRARSKASGPSMPEIFASDGGRTLWYRLETATLFGALKLPSHAARRKNICDILRVTGIIQDLRQTVVAPPTRRDSRQISLSRISPALTLRPARHPSTLPIAMDGWMFEHEHHATPNARSRESALPPSFSLASPSPVGALSHMLRNEIPTSRSGNASLLGHALDMHLHSSSAVGPSLNTVQVPAEQGSGYSYGSAELGRTGLTVPTNDSFLHILLSLKKDNEVLAAENRNLRHLIPDQRVSGLLPGGLPKTEPANSPRSLTSLTSLPPPLPVAKENFPLVTIWTIEQWNEKQPKASGATNLKSGSDIVALGAHKQDDNGLEVEAEEDIAKATKLGVVKRRFHFLQDRNGAVITSLRFSAITDTCRQVWNQLLQFGMAPPTWCRGVTHEANQYYISVITNKFEEFTFCDNNWKLTKFTSICYSSWYRNHGPKDPAKLKLELSPETSLPSRKRVGDTSVIRKSPKKVKLGKTSLNKETGADLADGTLITMKDDTAGDINFFGGITFKPAKAPPKAPAKAPPRPRRVGPRDVTSNINAVAGTVLDIIAGSHAQAPADARAGKGMSAGTGRSIGTGAGAGAGTGTGTGADPGADAAGAGVGAGATAGVDMGAGAGADAGAGAGADAGIDADVDMGAGAGGAGAGVARVGANTGAGAGADMNTGADAGPDADAGNSVAALRTDKTPTARRGLRKPEGVMQISKEITAFNICGLEWKKTHPNGSRTEFKNYWQALTEDKRQEDEKRAQQKIAESAAASA
ncbi:hypothetical protein EVG20_g1409 [Dentipellis fragilis]|uniref:Uncharacterized protein n=1 Tax=Dentipellis fragilis TaxID=205917 RepID=A0A4Y9ZAX4_9AGAM|nr:hypothetical protein EVG20_g1409 [Dentipellis fragilis]